MLKRIGKRIETALREVPRFPEAEGFISSGQYNGFIVQRITLEDVDQLYLIKNSLKDLAWRLATPPSAKTLKNE
jgi:DNA-binding GntR family transcriptional regulator